MQSSIADEITSIVILYVDMFRAIVEYRIFREGYTPLVVDVDWDRVVYRDAEVGKEVGGQMASFAA